MIDSEDLNKVKKQLKEERSPKILKAKSLEFNRKMIEYGNFDILLSPEENQPNDTLKNVNSGLNEYLAKTAAANKIALGIDLESLRKLNEKEKSKRLSKIKQNILLCRKYGAKIKLLNYKDKRNALSFLISLGASTSQAKEAISF